MSFFVVDQLLKILSSKCNLSPRVTEIDSNEEYKLKLKDLPQKSRGKIGPL